MPATSHHLSVMRGIRGLKRASFASAESECLHALGLAVCTLLPQASTTWASHSCQLAARALACRGPVAQLWPGCGRRPPPNHGVAAAWRRRRRSRRGCRGKEGGGAADLDCGSVHALELGELLPPLPRERRRLVPLALSPATGPRENTDGSASYLSMSRPSVSKQGSSSISYDLLGRRATITGRAARGLCCDAAWVWNAACCCTYTDAVDGDPCGPRVHDRAVPSTMRTGQPERPQAQWVAMVLLPDGAPSGRELQTLGTVCQVGVPCRRNRISKPARGKITGFAKFNVLNTWFCRLEIK